MTATASSGFACLVHRFFDKCFVRNPDIQRAPMSTDFDVFGNDCVVDCVSFYLLRVGWRFPYAEYVTAPVPKINFG